MNKIYLYSLGVFSWLSALQVHAIDKFDVLPDLPDPLAYAVQPAEAASVSGSTDTTILGTQSIGHEPSMISVVLSLLFVVLLIYLTGILYAKLNKVGFNTLKRQQGDLARSQVSVVSTTQLGNNKTLHVVELDGKRMLIGASSGAIQLIKDLGSINSTDEDDEYSHIEIPNIKIPKIEIPKIEIPSIGFSKIKTKSHKGYVKENIDQEEYSNENISVAVDENTSNSEKEIQSNPDEIIETLFSTHTSATTETVTEPTENEHVVDPDEYLLYKKYLG